MACLQIKDLALIHFPWTNPLCQHRSYLFQILNISTAAKEIKCLKLIKKQWRHYMDTSYKQENLHLCSPGFTINQTKVPRKRNAEDTAPSIKIVSPRAISDWMFYHRQSWVAEKKKLIHSSWLVKNCNNHVIPLRFCHFRALWFVMLFMSFHPSFFLHSALQCGGYRVL